MNQVSGLQDLIPPLDTDTTSRTLDRSEPQFPRLYDEGRIYFHLVFQGLCELLMENA